MDYRRILVTGGAGLIGIEVCRQLVKRGIAVNVLDLGEQLGRTASSLPKEVEVFYGSILDASTLRRAARNCDAVIHLAALLGVKRTESDRLRCLEVNIEGTKQVLEYSLQDGSKKFVFASSSEVYGEPLENPLTEKSVTQGKTVYAVTKLAGEELCKAYTQKYGVRHTILRYFNCYGPYQTAQFVVPKFIKNVQQDKPPVIYGSGKQVRSYVHVEDTAAATIEALFSDSTDGEILNIGGGVHPVSLVELAETVLKVAGKENTLKPEFLGSFDKSDRTADREINNRWCDSSKAMNILHWQAKIGLADGIRKVMDNGVIFENWIE